MIAYQDRILYATDQMEFPDIEPDDFKQQIHAKWLADWQFLATDAIMTGPDFDAAFQGLALPKKVIEKIYRLNAARMFPGAWRKPLIPS